MVEVCRHDDAGPQQADHHRTNVVGAGLPDPCATAAQGAQTATEAALLPPQHAGQGEDAGGPRQQQDHGQAGL